MLISKRTLYIALIVSAVSLNIFYYRYIFIQPWMRWQLRNETIIVSLSTTPYRINQIQDILQSIVNQNAPIAGIYLSVPYKFKRDNLDYEIPDWLAQHPDITIIRTDDYGPATKLLGVLKQLDLPDNAIIITLDDDTLYPKNIVLELAYKAIQEPNAAIGLQGANPIYGADGKIDLSSYLGITKITEADARVSILQGYTGVAYRRRFFDDRIFAIVDAPSACINSDDFYLSYFLARNNIPRIVLHNKYIFAGTVDWNTNLATTEDALHQMTPAPTVKHRACLDFLQEQYPNVIF